MEQYSMKVGDIACGRSGDKADTLDLSVVAIGQDEYHRLADFLTVERVQQELNRTMPGTVERYALPGLLALKFVIRDALPGGVYASLHAGLHWQKAAIYLLLDMDIED
jgi:hypothetical protein